MNPFCFPLHNFFGRCTLPHLCVCATKCRKLNRKPNHRGFRERSRSHGSQTWAGQKILNATLIFLFIKAKKRKMRGTKDYIEDGLLNFLRYLLTPNVDPFCILLIKGLLRYTSFNFLQIPIFNSIYTYIFNYQEHVTMLLCRTINECDFSKPMNLRKTHVCSTNALLLFC